MGKTPERGELNNGNALPIMLSGKEFLLPWVHVGNEDAGEWIAYYDPRKDDLCEAGAQALAAMLCALDTSLLVTPSSSKSDALIARARELAAEQMQKDIAQVVLTRGMYESENMRAALKDAVYTVDYSPITAGGGNRAMVVLPRQVEIFQQYSAHGIFPTFADDVYSTGATDRAMRILYDKAIGRDAAYHASTVAVMRECPANSDGCSIKEKPVHGLYYALRAPVVVGNSVHAPQGYRSEPFIGRTYTPAETAHLHHIAQNLHLPAQTRRSARMALAGMVDLHPTGLQYLTNTHH